MGLCVWTGRVLALLLFPRVQVLGLDAGRGCRQAAARTLQAGADPTQPGREKERKVARHELSEGKKKEPDAISFFIL